MGRPGARDRALPCPVDATPEDYAGLAGDLRALGDDRMIATCSGAPAGAPSTLSAPTAGSAEVLRSAGSRAPLWIRNTAATAVRGDNSFLSRLARGEFPHRRPALRRIGDLVSIETEADPARAVALSYNVLQGAGARISKAEFVACPSCGRTLFDLQTTTQRIRAQTGT
jgi:(E)-4-hydroxy-3-methylbut-2-enyl-diphosphate synthase